MYIHLGQDTIVEEKEVIGIFDLDNTTCSRWTRKTLRDAEDRGLVKNVGEDIPKSFVLCADNGKTTVYLSQLGTLTLKQRAEQALSDTDR